MLGIGEPLIGRLLTYDALGMRFREVRLRRDPKCPLCGEHPTIRDLSLHPEKSEACARAGAGGGAAPRPPAPAPAPAGGSPKSRSRPITRGGGPSASPPL